MKQLASDIDEILREGKRPIPEAVQASLSEHVKGGIFITGAPLAHVPAGEKGVRNLFS